MKIVRSYSLMLKQSHDYMFILCDFLGTETVQEARGNRQDAAIFVSMLASDVYSLFSFLKESFLRCALHLLHFKLNCISLRVFIKLLLITIWLFICLIKT